MGTHLIGDELDFKDGYACIVEVENREIGVFKVNGNLVAYENRCPHQGGPVCEGLRIGRVECEILSDGTLGPEVFSKEELHVVCPWHGFEYDLRTGENAVDRSFGLKSYSVSIVKGKVQLEV